MTPIRYHFAAVPETTPDPSTANDLAVGARALVVVDGEVPGGLVVPDDEVTGFPTSLAITIGPPKRLLDNRFQR